MYKNIILFISVISVSLSTYRPMSKKTIDFGSNVCHYREYDSSSSSSQIEYVKPCQEGKYCYQTESSNYQLYTCETRPNNKKKIGESCTTDFECADSSLECTQNTCQIKEDSAYVLYTTTNNVCVAHCKSTQIPFIKSGVPSCENPPASTSKTDFNKFYVKKNDVEYKVCGEPYQVPGKINFKTRVSGDYEVDTIDFADIGSLPVGTPVYDEKACETGFALYFYGDGTLIKQTGYSNMYLHCANLKEILSNDEVVYSLSDGTEKIYYTSRVSNSYPNTYTLSFTKYKDEVKLEMFKNYRDKLNGILTQCKSDYDYTEPYTCKNDELRKWFYFYNNPDKYMLYKDEKEIIDYLLQQNYGDYYSTGSTGSSGFIAFKYFFYLLILLSL